MDDVHSENDLTILDPKTFSSAAAWSFSVGLNMRTPRLDLWDGSKPGVSGCAPAGGGHCGARQLTWDATLYLSYNERCSQSVGCRSCSLFSPPLPVCRLPHYSWKSRSSKPRAGSSSVAAASNSPLRFSCWRTNVSFRSQPECQRQDSPKAKVNPAPSELHPLSSNHKNHSNTTTVSTLWIESRDLNWK